MSSNSEKTDEELLVDPAPRVFCQRKKSGNGSFVSSLRNHFHEFIHASVDEHKTCLRNAIQKILNASKVFGKNSDSTNEGCHRCLQLFMPFSRLRSSGTLLLGVCNSIVPWRMVTMD